jgi:hypothetical protein
VRSGPQTGTGAKKKGTTVPRATLAFPARLTLLARFKLRTQHPALYVRRCVECVYTACCVCWFCSKCEKPDRPDRLERPEKPRGGEPNSVLVAPAHRRRY